MTAITIKRDDSIGTTIVDGEELIIEKSSISFNLEDAIKAQEVLKSHPEFIVIHIPVTFNMFSDDGEPLDEIHGHFSDYDLESTSLSVSESGSLELVAIIKHLDQSFWGYFGTLENAMKENADVC